MRMYVACLASYNNGCLHGEWFDLEDYSDKDELQEAIAEKVLRTSPFPNVTRTEYVKTCSECGVSDRYTDFVDSIGGSDRCPHCFAVKFGVRQTRREVVTSSEEWAAHDYDGEGLDHFGEHPSLDKLLGHVQLVTEHGDAWLAYVSLVGEHYATEDGFLDAHLGECESAREYFESQLEDSGELKALPEHLRPYFDWEGYARDQEISGGYSFVPLNGTTYVFSG